MSLHSIVQKLGGDLFAGGAEALIPAPGHSKHDRSVSLKLANGRVVVNCFGGARWQEVLDALRDQGLIDRSNAPLSISGPGGGDYHGETRTDVERSEVARQIWDRARPIAGTLAERHVRLRKIRRQALEAGYARFAETAPLTAYKPSIRTKPALLVAITDQAKILTAIEMTYLDPDGARTTRLKLARKTIGVLPAGSSVKIDPAQPEMLVGEGFFTTLAASEHFHLPGHALLSIRNMGFWTPPEGVREILIAGDNGVWGRKAAFSLQARIQSVGLRARVKFPPEPFDDWASFAPELERVKG